MFEKVKKCNTADTSGNHWSDLRQDGQAELTYVVSNIQRLFSRPLTTTPQVLTGSGRLIPLMGHDAFITTLNRTEQKQSWSKIKKTSESKIGALEGFTVKVCARSHISIVNHAKPALKIHI